MEYQMNPKHFLETYDWEGLARTFSEGNIHWHEKEWKEFIEKIKKQEREKIAQVLQSKLDRKDNPVLDAGLIYAMTVLEIKN